MLIQPLVVLRGRNKLHERRVCLRRTSVNVHLQTPPWFAPSTTSSSRTQRRHLAVGPSTARNVLRVISSNVTSFAPIVEGRLLLWISFSLTSLCGRKLGIILTGRLRRAGSRKLQLLRKANKHQARTLLRHQTRKRYIPRFCLLSQSNLRYCRIHIQRTDKA